MRRETITLGLVTLVLSLSLAAPLAAGPFEDGRAAHERGDYATALRLWCPLADQGNAHAQFNLGSMYYLGQGVPQDYAEAVRWYRKAADQGDPIAQFNVGLMYQHGQGVLQSYAEAGTWYHKAADQGDANAQINLGGMCYEGRGVPQDFVQAHKWLSLAAAQVSGKDRATVVYNRDIIAAKMTPQEIAEAQKLAREWKPEGGK